VAAHLDTLVDASGHPSRKDLAQQIAPAIAAALFSVVGRVHLSSGTSVAILTIAGLFAAFLFQLTIQILDRAASWSESHPEPSEATSRYASLLEEMSANAAYASLIAALTAVGALAAVARGKGWESLATAAFVLALLVHLGTTLLMVLRRVFLLSRARLLTARTGSERS
jgi:hypothetical protein